MRVTYEQVVMSKGAILAFALTVPTLVVLLSPVMAQAQSISTSSDVAAETFIGGDVKDPNKEQDAQTIQAPGVPEATSPKDSKEIVWTWTKPEDGAAPDEPLAESEPEQSAASPTEDEQPVETEQPLPIDLPTDIVSYGFKLTKQGVLVNKGVVESTQYSVRTEVPENGEYIFELWSITRENFVSKSVFAATTIINPVLIIPDSPQIQLPERLGITPNTNIPTIQDVTNSSSYRTSAAPVVPSANESAAGLSVLSETTFNNSDEPRFSSDAVVRPSSQGWLVAGMPWYAWLLIIAVVFSAWRFLAKLAQSRS